ncbi:hypothetical protein RQP46_007561 [Phenoliferia psychrophenolica]
MPLLRDFICRRGNIAFEPYGNSWRELRKETHRELNISNVHQYAWIQQREAYYLAMGLLDREVDLLVLSERFGGAIGLGAVYDMPVNEYHSPVIAGFNRVLEGKLKMLIPGASFYDLLPWFRWAPEWLIPSKRTGRLVREESERLDAQMRKPEIQAQLQAYVDEQIGRDRMPSSDDLDALPYVRAFVLEIVRWRGIARFGVPHCNLADDTFVSNGKVYFIPAGSAVIGNSWAMDRDPAVFPEPEEIRPERYLHKDGTFNYSVPISAFGFGRRVCPGQNLAHNSLIMVAACFAWSFTFTKGRDASGREIEPDIGSEAVHDGGNVYRPAPFAFEVAHRFPEVADMIRQTVKTSVASGAGGR